MHSYKQTNDTQIDNRKGRQANVEMDRQCGYAVQHAEGEAKQNGFNFKIQNEVKTVIKGSG